MCAHRVVTFLENFFSIGGPFDYETDLVNYLNDLRLYSDHPLIRENQEKLREAFFEIVETLGSKQGGFMSEIAGYEIVSLDDHVAYLQGKPLCRQC